MATNPELRNQSNIARVRDARVTIKKGAKKVKSLSAAGTLAYTLVWFYPVQLLFSLLFIFMIYVEEEWYWRGMFIPAEEMYMLSWVLLIALGTGFMLYAFAVFAIARVQLFRHPMIFLTFCLCLGGYWAPYLFLFPWVFLWIAVVVAKQK